MCYWIGLGEGAVGAERAAAGLGEAPAGPPAELGPQLLPGGRHLSVVLGAGGHVRGAPHMAPPRLRRVGEPGAAVVTLVFLHHCADGYGGEGSECCCGDSRANLRLSLFGLNK